MDRSARDRAQPAEMCLRLHIQHTYTNMRVREAQAQPAQALSAGGTGTNDENLFNTRRDTTKTEQIKNPARTVRTHTHNICTRLRYLCVCVRDTTDMAICVRAAHPPALRVSNLLRDVVFNGAFFSVLRPEHIVSIYSACG